MTFQMVEWGELSFKIVWLDNAGQQVLPRASNFMVARAAFDTSVSWWPNANIEIPARCEGDPFHEPCLNLIQPTCD